MTEQQYIVICGPEMTKDEGVSAFRAYCAMAQVKMGLEAFPEGIMGAESVRQLVQHNIDSGYSMAYLTRYASVVYTLGNAIHDRQIKPEQVKVFLVRDGAVVMHTFDHAGRLDGSWPFGILS